MNIMNEYNLFARIQSLNINHSIELPLTWDTIENKIKENNNMMDDGENYYPKINKTKDINEINYKLCVDRIVNCCIERKKDYKLLFSFNVDDQCPLTNYSYMMIFFGPIDDLNYYDITKQKIHILNKIGSDVLFKIYNGRDGKIRFDIIL